MGISRREFVKLLGLGAAGAAVSASLAACGAETVIIPPTSPPASRGSKSFKSNATFKQGSSSFNLKGWQLADEAGAKGTEAFRVEMQVTSNNNAAPNLEVTVNGKVVATKPAVRDGSMWTVSTEPITSDGHSTYDIKVGSKPLGAEAAIPLVQGTYEALNINQSTGTDVTAGLSNSALALGSL